jgi:signal peptidase I
MRTVRLDRRVRAEANSLVREARAALRDDKQLKARAGELVAAVGEIEAGLAANDGRRIRLRLPALDALVDELVKVPGKSLARDYIQSIGSAVLIAFALRAMVVAVFEIPSSSMYPTVEINDHIFVNKLIYGLQIPFTNKKLFPWRKPERGEIIVFLQPCTPDRDYIKRVIATEGQTVEVRCNIVYVDHQEVKSEMVLDGKQCSYEDKLEGSNEWFDQHCSEYAEQVPGRSYHTYHDADRPRRDALARDHALTAANSHDFPLLDGARFPPSCSRQPDGEPFASPNQATGEIRSIAGKDNAGACEQQLYYVVPPGHVFAMGDNRSNSTDSRSWGSVPIENIRGKAMFIWLSYRDLSPIHWGMRWARMGSFVE